MYNMICNFLFSLLVGGSILLSVGFSQNSAIRPDMLQIEPDQTWLNQKEGPRPKYVWENKEDVMYHDRFYVDSAKMTAPEIFPLMRGIWVFNRSMKWINTAGGNILAFSDGGDLQLTGTRQVSAWYSDPENKVYSESGSTIFEKQSNRRRRDCAVLPSFQFHLSQHPVLVVDVEESTDDWQFVVSMKGRSGSPLLSSGWQRGSRTITFDLRHALRKKGYDLNYAELHFVIGTWCKSAEGASRMKFKAALVSQPAVVGCLPIIRSVQSPDSVSVAAVVTGSTDTALTVKAVVNGQAYALLKNGGIWQGKIKRPDVGSYKMVFESNKPEVNGSAVLLRVTDGTYWRHNEKYNILEKNNKPAAPLTGSFQGTFLFKDAGLSSEQLINSQKQWEEWDKAEAPGEHQHYWESLNRSEMSERFWYLSRNGWDVVFLHSHYGIWERFDASGNLAPYGTEQFAAYVDEASKAGLAVQVTLSSYPYGDAGSKDFRDGTNPYLQTIEKGFKIGDWHNPENEPFRTIYHKYLKDFVGLFKDETAILSLSSSGEGDAGTISGVRRFQDTRDVIKGIDTNHVIVSEPIQLLQNITSLPQTLNKGFNSDLVGVRNYWMGKLFHPDVEMSLFLRLMQSVPNAFIAEGSYPSSNVYTRFGTTSDTWLGTPYYRYNLRDWLYLGFVNRMPLMLTWDEALAEDEHLVIAKAREFINWKQSWKQPEVSVLLTERDFAQEKYRLKLGKFEEVFSRLGVDYRYIFNKGEAKKGDWVLDVKKGMDSLKYRDVPSLPESVRNNIPFFISPDYATRYSVSEDGKTLVGYLFNKTHYIEHEFYLSGTTHRIPKAGLFKVTMNNIAPGLNYRLYDLDRKTVVSEGKTSREKVLAIEGTKADYLLIVYP